MHNRGNRGNRGQDKDVRGRVMIQNNSTFGR
jgi:hypothetical protein